MTTNDLRKAYLDFMQEQGHTIVPSASLLPENDPTTLFTTAGMQPMITYLLGESHPAGKRIADSQKCFRTQDIDEVGDNRHTTFFEMLGNWSLGDYFKEEQIAWMFTFLVKRVGLDPNRLYVTAFGGSEEFNIPRDEESAKLWQQQFEDAGVEAKIIEDAEENGMQGGRIFYYDAKKNWWSRAGVPEKMPAGEPGGPDTEMFWDFGEECGLHEASEFADQPCHVNCDCGRFMEIGNNVFMEYLRTEEGFAPLPAKNVDFGGGFERIAAALKDSPDVFLIDMFDGARGILEKLSGKTYGSSVEATRAMRIIMDHLRAATFLIADGAVPSNKDQGYFTRRLIRRAVRHSRDLGITDKFAADVAAGFIETYREAYPELVANREQIVSELRGEEEKFHRTLEKGLREFEKMFEKSGEITGEDAFVLYSTYGFPLELTRELASDKGQKVDVSVFEEEFKKHQDLSRAGSEQKFAGGLADHSEECTRLHTATHLLHQALRTVLGDHVEQKGSNITTERLRFDFSHPDKMTDEQKTEVERLVNEQIEKDLPVHHEMLTLEEAKSRGAIGLFEDKYAQIGDKIKVYFIGDEAAGTDFSKEVCGGPHVTRTGELGHFKITKEQSASAGVRRIKATVTGPQS